MYHHIRMGRVGGGLRWLGRGDETEGERKGGGSHIIQAIGGLTLRCTGVGRAKVSRGLGVWGVWVPQRPKEVKTYQQQS